MFNKKWKVLPFKTRKFKESQLHVAAIVVDDNASNNIILYAHNPSILEHIVKIHNTIIEKMNNEDRRS